ncbi:MAG: O-antigen ligase family protein [Bacteroidetes bacterium]|nr:O-antigen ligase family protein [Bacteroidota bacterium]
MLSVLKDFKFLFLLELLLIIAFIASDYTAPLIIFGAIVFILSLKFLYEHPVYILYLLLFSILAGSIGEVKIGGKIPQILFVDIFFPFIFLVLILRTLFDSDRKKNWHLFSTLLLIFLVWGLLSFLVAVDKLRTLLIWKSYFYGLIFFLFTYRFTRSLSDIKTTIRMLILFGVVLSLIEFSIIIELGGLTRGIVGLFFKKNLLATSWGKSNYLATFYVLLIPLTIGYFLFVKSLNEKILVAISVIIMFSAIVFTLSRGGMLALAVAIVFLLARVLKPKTFLPILFTIIFVVLILLLNPLTYVLIDRIATFEQSFSYYTRLNFYKDVWQMFLDNPIIGVGIGNLGYHAKFIILDHASAHNIVLGLLGETGIPGALVFISLLISVFVYFIKSYRRENIDSNKILLWSFLSSIVGVYVHSLMEPNFEGFQFSIVFWTSVGLMVRFTEISKISNSETPSYNEQSVKT